MNIYRNSRELRQGGKARRGVAALEFAVCLPLLLAVVMGFIEAANAILLKERLTSAAYECARSATTPGQTVTASTAAANNILAQFGIVGGSVAITPQITTTTPIGTSVLVSVSAPLASNLLMPPYIFGVGIDQITATVVMVYQ